MRERYASLWELTEREEEILVLMADGLSNNEIAARFGISERTVRSHCCNILSKMRAPNRTAAAALVWRERVAQLEAEVTKWRELAEGTAALWTEARDELAELRLCKRAS